MTAEGNSTVGTSEFVIPTRQARYITVNYNFLATESEIDSAAGYCYSPDGLKYSTSGSIEMITFGNSFENINIGIKPFTEYCTFQQFEESAQVDGDTAAGGPFIPSLEGI